MSFGSPKYLYLLLLLPLAVLQFWIILHYIERIRGQFRMAKLARLSHASGRGRYLRLALLFSLGCGSLIGAVADPQLERIKQEPIYKKVDLIFILDTSLSMRTRDIPPSRLTRAGEEIRNFVLHRNDNIDQLGLVTFSGSSMILSYLTEDLRNVLFYLDYLESDPKHSFGTDIGSAIKSALTLLKKEQELDDSLRAEDVVFVLISDGEDHGQTLREAVQECIQLGIRTYCLGLGSEMGGYIPIGEESGRTLFLIDENGDKVLATFDEGTMRWISKVTGARYYRSRSGSELYRNLNEVLWNERQTIGMETVKEKTSLHRWFLVAAFASLAVFLIN